MGGMNLDYSYRVFMVLQDEKLAILSKNWPKIGYNSHSHALGVMNNLLKSKMALWIDKMLQTDMGYDFSFQNHA